METKLTQEEERVREILISVASTREIIYYTELCRKAALKLEPEFTKGNSPYVKSKASRGENAGTWLSPIMFIDFAMWLNPAFKVKVLKFVQDEMIKFRNLAGDAYPTMCKAVSSILPDDIFKQKVRDLAKSLNIIKAII